MKNSVLPKPKPKPKDCVETYFVLFHFTRMIYAKIFIFIIFKYFHLFIIPSPYFINFISKTTVNRHKPFCSLSRHRFIRYCISTKKKCEDCWKERVGWLLFFFFFINSSSLLSWSCRVDHDYYDVVGYYVTTMDWLPIPLHFDRKKMKNYSNFFLLFM